MGYNGLEKQGKRRKGGRTDGEIASSRDGITAMMASWKEREGGRRTALFLLQSKRLGIQILMSAMPDGHSVQRAASQRGACMLSGQIGTSQLLPFQLLKQESGTVPTRIGAKRG